MIIRLLSYYVAGTVAKKKLCCAVDKFEYCLVKSHPNAFMLLFRDRRLNFGASRLQFLKVFTC